jgi:hypothetical protein
LSCTGYRDANSLRLRDESASIRRRIEGGSPHPPPAPLKPHLDELARAAFYAHYVRGFSTTYNVLDEICRTSGEHEHLSASLDAVSLAFFHFQFNIEAASKPAQESYLKALPSLQLVISKTGSPAENSTMLAVLFLDLYEKISHRDPLPQQSWLSHIRGGMALMRLRKISQLNTYAGLRLSTRLFTNMLISCIAAEVGAPSDLMRLHRQLISRVQKDDPKWQASSLALRYVSFREAIRTDSLAPDEAICAATQLDDEFRALAADLPLSWIAHRVLLEKDSQLALHHYYDVYPDYFTAQTCNVMRIMRILLNDQIKSLLSDQGFANCYEGRVDARLALCSQTIDALAQEICAAGPQFMHANQMATSPATRIQKLHCYTLLFPFYIAARYASLEAMVRPWVVHQLDHMADTFGMRNAKLLSEMLCGAQTYGPWSVYTMLGSYAFAA